MGEDFPRVVHRGILYKALWRPAVWPAQLIRSPIVAQEEVLPLQACPRESLLLPRHSWEIGKRPSMFTPNVAYTNVSLSL